MSQNVKDALDFDLIADVLLQNPLPPRRQISRSIMGYLALV